MIAVRTERIERGVWRAMKARCQNENHKAWKYYGGKGISVCQRWLESFDNFFADMGPRPPGDMMIERLDGNGNYEPSNCVWADRKAQNRNKPGYNHPVTFNSQTKCISEWAEITGINERTISSRIVRLGWTAEEALTTPADCTRMLKRIAERRRGLKDVYRKSTRSNTGHYGVSIIKSGGWIAQFGFGGKRIYLGTFAIEADAIAAVRAKHAELQGSINAS